MANEVISIVCKVTLSSYKPMMIVLQTNHWVAETLPSANVVKVKVTQSHSCSFDPWAGGGEEV